jgi:hypothetical protein
MEITEPGRNAFNGDVFVPTEPQAIPGITIDMRFGRITDRYDTV